MDDRVRGEMDDELEGPGKLHNEEEMCGVGGVVMRGETDGHRKKWNAGVDRDGEGMDGGVDEVVMSGETDEWTQEKVKC